MRRQAAPARRAGRTSPRSTRSSRSSRRAGPCPPIASSPSPATPKGHRLRQGGEAGTVEDEASLPRRIGLSRRGGPLQVVERRGGGLRQGRLVAAQPTGEAGEALGAQALLGQQRQQAPQPGAAEAGSAFEGSRTNGQPWASQVVTSRAFGTSRKGPEGDTNGTRAVEDASRRHPGEPCRAGAGAEPHQHRLGLVVAGVGGQHQVGPCLVGESREKAVALGPRRRLQPCGRLRPGPGQDPVRQAEARGEIRDIPWASAREPGRRR